MPRVLRLARPAGGLSRAVASKPRRTLPVLVVFLVTLVVPVHALAAAPAIPTYLAIGDSLSLGIGATVPSEFGLVGRLQQYIRVHHRGTERFANLAVGGETSTSFITGGQLARAQAAIADSTSDVQLITLTIGGNDFLRLLDAGGPCRSDPSTLTCRVAVAAMLQAFAQNYSTILAGLRTALATEPGSAQILVMAYFNPFGGTGSPLEPAVNAVLLGSDGRIDCLAAQLDPTKVGLNDLIACIGAAYGVQVVDAYPIIVTNALALTHIAEGDIHPNNVGYALIANAFIAALRPF